MSNEAVFYENGIELNITPENGQVFKPAVGDIQFRAGTRKNPGARLIVTFIVPEDICPTGDSINWLMPVSGGGKLRQLVGLLVFDQGTLSFPEAGSQ